MSLRYCDQHPDVPTPYPCHRCITAGAPIPGPQLTLPLEPLVIPEPTPNLDERWARFHEANPTIVPRLARMARDVMAKTTRRPISMKMLWESLRLEYVQTSGDGGYALNNSLTSRAARCVMETYPDLAGVFETRKLPSKDEAA